MDRYNLPDKIKFRGCRIVYRNFSGAPDDFNKAGGKRSFAVVIDDPKLADKLEEDGWKLKRRPPRDEGGDEFITLKVNVNYDYKAPKIYTVVDSGNGKQKKTLLTESTVGQLDHIDTQDILDIKLSVVPHYWNNSNGEGISAYCKVMWVTIEPDDFEDEFDFEDEDDEVPFDV